MDKYDIFKYIADVYLRSRPPNFDEDSFESRYLYQKYKSLKSMIIDLNEYDNYCRFYSSYVGNLK